MQRSNWQIALILGFGSHLYLGFVLVLMQTLTQTMRFKLDPSILGALLASSLALSLFTFACLRWLQGIWRTKS